MAMKQTGMSVTAKAKMSRAMKGRRNPFYGKCHTKAWKDQERRRKQGRKNPMFGRKHRPGTIRKMRQAMMRRLGQ